MDQDNRLTRAVVLIVEIDVAGVFLPDCNIRHRASPLRIDMRDRLDAARSLEDSEVRESPARFYMIGLVMRQDSPTTTSHQKGYKLQNISERL